jgi:predicted ester cyclase
MTDNGLAVYCRYNACCNEHRFDDLAEFVARDVVITGTDRALDACAERLRAVIRAFLDYHWELRHHLIRPPWITAHFADTGTHRGPFLDVPGDRPLFQHPGAPPLSTRRWPDRRRVGHRRRPASPAPAPRAQIRAAALSAPPQAARDDPSLEASGI